MNWKCPNCGMISEFDDILIVSGEEKFSWTCLGCVTSFQVWLVFLRNEPDAMVDVAKLVRES